MAPATDIADTDAVTALQAVTDTEGGVMFADAAGNMAFHKRTRRWNPVPATVVFGENAAAGELPYEDQPVFDYDPTLVTNLAEVTHSATGVVYTATRLRAPRPSTASATGRSSPRPAAPRSARTRHSSWWSATRSRASASPP